MADDDKLQIALLMQKVDSLTASIDKITSDHETRLRIVEDKLTTLGERLTLWQIFQTSLTAIASGAAVFFGRQP